jgi:hypothetical protein
MYRKLGMIALTSVALALAFPATVSAQTAHTIWSDLHD